MSLRLKIRAACNNSEVLWEAGEIHINALQQQELGRDFSLYSSQQNKKWDCRKRKILCEMWLRMVCSAPNLVENEHYAAAPFSGEHGIRTHGPLRDTAFREPHLKPLGQLSIIRNSSLLMGVPIFSMTLPPFVEGLLTEWVSLLFGINSITSG